MADYSFFLRLMSLDSVLSTAHDIERVLASIAQEKRSFRLPGKRRCVLGSGDLASALQSNPAKLYDIGLSANCEASIQWHEPSFVEFHRPRFRVDLALRVCGDWALAEQTLFQAVGACHSYWAELNEVSVTGCPTMCNLDGHRYTIPHLGSANFFGSEYLHFFGGIGKMRAAGFSHVQDFMGGAYTVLPKCKTQSEYLAVRQKVEACLCDPQVFDPSLPKDGLPLERIIQRCLLCPQKSPPPSPPPAPNDP